MELKEIMQIQRKFDERHAGNFDWSTHINQKNTDVLAFLMIALTGEVGELSNIVKKILRGDMSLEFSRENIEEEVVDIFIYVIKICNQMSIDLEEKYFEKLTKNKKRFKKYEKE